MIAGIEMFSGVDGKQVGMKMLKERAPRHVSSSLSFMQPASPALRLSQSLAQRSGTVSRISSGTRQSALTLSDVCWRRICLRDTSACSALEVDNFMRYINLLTYLLQAPLDAGLLLQMSCRIHCISADILWLASFPYFNGTGYLYICTCKATE